MLKEQGRLSDKVTDELQNYYGKAIRENTSDLQGMTRVVWAIYFHRLSRDNRQVIICAPSFSPVSYTHLDVYKRQQSQRIHVKIYVGTLK